MSRSCQSFLHFKPAALAPAREIKQQGQHDSPYESSVKRIETYPKNGTDEEKKPFQEQFNQLVNQLEQWGEEQKVSTATTKTCILKMKSNFFLPEYSGMQPAIYFETIKIKLEKILLALKNNNITLTKRTKAYDSLCNHFAVCGPGLYTHIEDVYLSLYSEISLTQWLANFRTNLIRIYSDQHNSKHKIKTGNSIHTLNTFVRYAEDEQWHPTFSAGKIQDPHFTHARVAPEDLVDFHRFFVSEYNPSAIRACIQTNLDCIINDLFNEFAFKTNEWNSARFNPKDQSEYEIKKSKARQSDYYALIEKIGNTFEMITISLEELIEFNEDYTQFRLRDTHLISNLLYDRDLDIGPGVYCDTVKKINYDLAPEHWLDAKQTPHEIDFLVWNKIPDQDFASVLFRLLKRLPNQYVKPLLEKIPYEKITQMTQENTNYALELSMIDDDKKRALILETINGSIKQKPTLDTLLLHVIHGEQDEAEKIIKADPNILLMSDRVVDYSGRTIEGTAFQLALGAEDAEMCEMLAPYFTLLKDGKAEQAKQYLAQFPEQKNNQEHEKDIAALKQLFKTIGESKNDEDCESALTIFREQLKPKSIIKTGKHFHAELLLTAYRLYSDHYKAFGGLDSRKNTMCWRNVIGYIQRYFPACYAEAFCQGRYDLIEERNKLKRSLEFSKDRGVLFFPLAATPSGLGFTYASCFGYPTRKTGATDVAARGWASYYKEYVNQQRTRCDRMQPVKMGSSMAFGLN